MTVLDQNLEPVSLRVDEFGRLKVVGTGGGGGGVSDHGDLTGLADDDHPQYLNNARGDARYPLASSLGTASLRDVAATGDASALQVVKGNDSRLTDAREWTAATVTQAEAEAGTDTARKAFTVQRVWQAMAAWLLTVSTAAGRAIMTAADAAAQRTAMGAAASGAIGSSGLTISTARLLGRSTAGTGALEEITLGTNLSLTGTTLNAAGGGGSPGGSTTQIQFNNAGAFGGASGLTTTGTELTISSGTKTTSAPVLDLSQTWNAGGVTFTARRTNITDTASAAASLLEDWQVGSATRFSIEKNAVINLNAPSGNEPTLWMTLNGTRSSNIRGSSGRLSFAAFSASDMIIFRYDINCLQLSNNSRLMAGGDSAFRRESAGVWAIDNDTAGQYRDLRLRNLIAEQLVQTKALTVATLPAAASWPGAEAYVTDANAPTVGSTVASGGSGRARVSSNGTNWIVTAVI